MADSMPKQEWNSRVTFILAATGSAVGLGNIWKFPALVIDNGGGAFVLLYLFCVVSLAAPLMMTEVLIGKHARSNPVHAIARLARQSGASPRWRMLGWLFCATGLLILSYYSVIGGWAMAYVEKLASGAFTSADAPWSGQLFTRFLADPSTLILWHTGFLVLVTLMVAAGVKRGLGVAMLLMMPMLVLCLVLLLIFSMSNGEFLNAAGRLFTLDFDALRWSSLVSAMEHAFFTLSIGMGVLVAYGAYMPATQHIPNAVFWVVVLDTSIALIAGMVILPLLLGTGVANTQGPGMMFVGLPLAFGNVFDGQVFGAVFFVLVVLAALTSAISLLEPSTAWFSERFGVHRAWAALLFGIIVWLMGLGTVFSFNYWSDVYLIGGATFFVAIDFLTAKILLPLCGLLLAVFAGWIVRREIFRVDPGNGGRWMLLLWRGSMRFLAPPAVLLIFVVAVGA